MMAWLLKGFAVVRSAFTAARLWVYAGAITAALTAAWFGYWSWHDEVKQSGVDECRVATYRANEKVLATTTARIRAEYQVVLAASEARRATALALVQELESRDPEVIYREIYRVAEAVDCKRLGTDFVGVYNQALGTDPNPTGGGSDRPGAGSNPGDP